MSNNLESNFTRKVMMKVLDRFESNRVLSKNVDTQLFKGQFNPNTGTQIDVKRPTDYTTISTADGNISTTRSDIITGKATATVQNYITVAVDYDEVDEALKMGTDISRLWDDIGNRMVVALETTFAAYVVKETALLSGTHGNGVEAWAEVAQAGALMQSAGVPMNKPWSYFLNPYSQTSLAGEQRGLGVNPEVKTANDMALIQQRFAGFDVRTATTLPTYTSSAGADRAGTLSANPDVTYVTAKDTMQQTLAVTAFQANLVVKAGEQIQITGRNRLNQSTRDPILTAAGATVVFTGTVVADVTLGASGEGNIVISGPAIYEASGAYNTVDSAPVSGDVVTLLGAASTVYQPNLFWHPDAFTIASVNIKKLHSTDTVATTRDGLQMRVSKYSDGNANSQTVRFDLHPAFGTMNPYFAGQAFGNA